MGNDGGGLWASLAFDSEDNLYGTTSGGGAHGDGTVFELTPKADGTWSETILHSFPSFPDDGGVPQSTPIFDAAGNLYATAMGGGVHNSGTVFELAHGSWAETALYNFCSKPHCRVGRYQGFLVGRESREVGQDVPGSAANDEPVHRVLLEAVFRPDHRSWYALLT